MNQTDFHRTLEEYYAIFIKINGLYSAFARERGLSYHALFILYAIYHSGDGCTPTEISNRWLIPKQTVNSVLRSFDQRGFVRYETCPRDRRGKQISLTPAGREYARPLLEGLYAAETAALEKMGAEAHRLQPAVL